MIKITDNFQVNKPAPIDDRLGPFVSTAVALSSIELDRRYIGLTVIVDTGSGATEYWFEDGIQNNNLVAKPTGGGVATWGTITGTLSNQTDLNTELNGKFNNPTGTTAQYLDGLGTPTDFPTAGQAGTLVRQVRNETGATLSKGTVVYISGASGNKALVSKAIATGDGTSAQTFGVVQADITNNQNGYVVVRGDLSGLNTSAFTEGAQLYLSSTTAGEYTSTKQYAPAHLVYIAIVTRSHVNQGSIEVAIQNGFELDELHDVVAQTPSNRNGLFFNSSNNLWESRAIVEADLPTLNAYPRVYFVNSSASASVTTLAKIFEGSAINITDLRVGTTFICTGFYTGSASSTKGFGLSSNNTTPTLATASFTSGQFYFVARYIGGVNGTLRISRVGGNGFGVSATTSYVDINASSGTHTLSFWGSSSTGTIIVEHCLIQMIY